MKGRITSSKETSTGNLSDHQVKFMREINLNPTFDRKTKPWKLVKIPKSTTRNVAWHIAVNDRKFIAVQYYAKGEGVAIYDTDEKFRAFKPTDLVKNYPSYVDLEVAIDEFYNEQYGSNEQRDTESEPSTELQA
jgi:hypothetical protein